MMTTCHLPMYKILIFHCEAWLKYTSLQFNTVYKSNGCGTVYRDIDLGMTCCKILALLRIFAYTLQKHPKCSLYSNSVATSFYNYLILTYFPVIFPLLLFLSPLRRSGRDFPTGYFPIYKPLVLSIINLFNMA